MSINLGMKTSYVTQIFSNPVQEGCFTAIFKYSSLKIKHYSNRTIVRIYEASIIE